MAALDSTYNIARRLETAAQSWPHKRALVYPQARDRAGRVAYTHLTFAQLNALADRYAWGLQAAGLGRGSRTLLMVRMSLDFTALAFALFKIGAVPVMIDPGMGLRGFLNCVRQVAPEGFIGIPAAHLVRLLFRRSFRHVRVPVTLGRRWCWGGLPLARLAGAQQAPYPTAAMAPDELAAILFTSGSTGPAKGVVYTHRIFETQVRILAEEFGLGADNIDLPCFPLFGLFSTGLGCTAVIPQMDPTHPARVDPRRIVEAVVDHGVTYSFGSPALWRVVGQHCADRQIVMPTLRRIFLAGAPVPANLHRLLLEHALPPGAETYTPYGATESLPVSCFTGSAVLAETAAASATGAGICVGRPVAEATVRIIAIRDEAIPDWSQAQLLATGEIGEIVVKGPMVTPAYYAREQQTRLAKIADGDGFWHRIGDLGYFDPQGRLWMCGRKAHRVDTANGMLCSVCCEAIFNAHPRAFRTALVGIGDDRRRQTPAIVVEPHPGQFPTTAKDKADFIRELLALGAANPLTADIRHVLFCKAFPVDVRHNVKINRESLAAFAQARLPSTG